YYLTRQEVIGRVGLFDPLYFLYYEEIDHCRAVRDAGWKIMYFPFTQVVHIGGESAQKVGALTNSGRQVSALQIESELLYFRKHFGLRGMLGAVVLSLLADILSCGKSLLRSFDIGRTRAAATHVKTIFSILSNTRF